MPKPKRDRTRPPLDVAAAADKYRAGASLRALAAESGYCYGTVRRRLLDYGETLRPPGGNRRPAASAA
jgi:transposase